MAQHCWAGWDLAGHGSALEAAFLLGLYTHSGSGVLSPTHPGVLLMVGVVFFLWPLLLRALTQFRSPKAEGSL
jgi:hypothetical protein